MYQAIYEKEWADFVDEVIGRSCSNDNEVFRVTAADVLLLDQVIRFIDAGSAKADQSQKLSPPASPATPDSKHRDDETIDDGTPGVAVQWYKRLRTPLARSAAKKMMRLDDEAFNSQPTPAFKLEVARTLRKPSNPSPAAIFESGHTRQTTDDDRNFAERLRRFSVGSSSDGDLTTDRLERTPVVMSQTQLDLDDDLLCLTQQSADLSEEKDPSVLPGDRTLLELESTILEESTQVVDSQGSPLIRQLEGNRDNRSPSATASTQSQDDDDDDATCLEVSGSVVHWGCSPIVGSPGQLEDPDATVLDQSPIQQATPASVSSRLDTSEDAEWRALQAVTTPVSRHRRLGDTLSAAGAAHDNDELEPDDLCRRMSAMQMSPVDAFTAPPSRSAMLAFDIGSRKATGRSHTSGSLTDRPVDERVIPVLEWMSRKESAEEFGASQHGGLVFVHTSRPSLGPALRWTSIPRRLALVAFAHLFETRQRLPGDGSPTPMGGTLVITSRTRLDEWAEPLAGHSELSVHLYTEPLSRRLECDRQSLMGYSVVITTSDIVRTSEVKHAISSRRGAANDVWHRRTTKFHAADHGSDHQPQQPISQLHLIRWDRVLVDDGTMLKRGTARFDAIDRLNAVNKWVVFIDVAISLIADKVAAGVRTFIEAHPATPLVDLAFRAAAASPSDRRSDDDDEEELDEPL